ncbi:MAG: hypothetical protein H8D78_22520 [Chloroflexi bacterium]|nr:hypothetical protein [Chloroflexota bacterium]
MTTTEESPRLTEATVQEIQLELIRRHQHNYFEGEEVAEDLMAHREWWEAVLMDTSAGLVKLRDLGDNFWNVDTLYILATSEPNARRLAELGERWSADSVVVYDEEETNSELGGGIEEQRLVTMWWD